MELCLISLTPLVVLFFEMTTGAAPSRSAFNVSLPKVKPHHVTFPSVTLKEQAAFFEIEVQKQIERQYEETETRLRSAIETNKKNPIKNAQFQTELDQIISSKLDNKLKPKIKFEFGQSNHDLVKPNGTVGIKHGLIATVVSAYNNHLPLELTPDDIWTLIAQGIAQYLGGSPEKAELHRKKFVKHKGKKQLVVKVGPGVLNEPGSPQNADGWPQVIKLFGEAIKVSEQSNLSTIMTEPFSTSGPIEEAVAAATLMETMKNYFEYKAIFLCGIPWIMLHGSIADYESIQGRLAKLKSLFPDFAWWLDTVARHVGKLKQTIEGNPDVDWWSKTIFKEPLGSGGQKKLSGWIGDFVPYGFQRGQRVENRNGAIALDDLSYGVSITDVILQNGYSSEDWHIKVLSGFLGASQNEQTLSLRPALGWITYYEETGSFLKPASVASKQP
jgi:hypothetical protein